MSAVECIVSFEEFMRRALHDPERGYYARNITTVGRRGDFTTVPMVTGVLASALARWIGDACERTGIRNVIEIGPGDGTLLRAIFQSMPFWKRRRFRLHVVETSRSLEQLQRANLGGRCRWFSHPAEALAACGGKALIYSNELVDAFPVRRFEKSGKGWKEVGVRLRGGLPAGETLLEVKILPDSVVFDREFPDGQRVEVHDAYRRWLVSWVDDWKEGAMLTIDYGEEAAGLYHRQPQGSVRGYLLQQRVEGAAIYQNMGRQDLTADVNFTDLIGWGAGWMDHHPVRSLREFCGPDFPAWLQQEGGAGDAFLVLEQRRRRPGG